MHRDGPPEEKLPFGLSRETDIVRTADGRWFHEGAPIENPKLARAFDRWVTRAEDGTYGLQFVDVGAESASRLEHLVAHLPSVESLEADEVEGLGTVVTRIMSRE